MTPPLAKKKFDATIKGECSEHCYGLLVDSPHLLWSVSGQCTPVMLRNKSSILDVVCHVAMCLVTQLAGTFRCATGQSLLHISNIVPSSSRSRGLRPPPLNMIFWTLESEGTVYPKGPAPTAQ